MNSATINTTGSINSSTGAITGGLITGSSFSTTGAMNSATINTTGSINSGTGAITGGLITGSSFSTTGAMNSATINTTGTINSGSGALTCGTITCNTITTNNNNINAGTGTITGGALTASIKVNTILVEPTDAGTAFNLCSTQTGQLNIGTASGRTGAINIGTNSGAINIGTLTGSTTTQAITIGNASATLQTITFNRPIITNNNAITAGTGTISTSGAINGGAITGTSLSSGTGTITGGAITCGTINCNTIITNNNNINAGTGSITGRVLTANVKVNTISVEPSTSSDEFDLCGAHTGILNIGKGINRPGAINIGSGTGMSGTINIATSNTNSGAINIGTGTNNSGAISIGTSSGNVNIGTSTASGMIQAITIGSTTANENQTITFNRPLTCKSIDTQNSNISTGTGSISSGDLSCTAINNATLIARRTKIDGNGLTIRDDGDMFTPVSISYSGITAPSLTAGVFGAGNITGGLITATTKVNTILVEPSDVGTAFNLCSTQTGTLNIGTASTRTGNINIGTGQTTGTGNITIGSTGITGSGNQTITFNRPLTINYISSGSLSTIGGFIEVSSTSKSIFNNNTVSLANQALISPGIYMASYSIQNTLSANAAFTETVHLLSSTPDSGTGTLSNIYVRDAYSITRTLGTNIYHINNAGILVLTASTTVYITVRYTYTGGTITATSNLRLVRIG
jgi:hypothetical protein